MKRSDKRSGLKIEISYLSMAASIHQLTEPAIRSAIFALNLPKGSQGLDAGCGVGDHTLWLAETVSPGGHVTGVDISEECISQAENASRAADLEESASFQFADLKDLPFDDNVFDWAWCADALWIGPESLGLPAADPSVILNELVRVVKPGGTIALLFWSSQKLLPGHPLLEARLNATRAANYPYSEETEPEMHIMRALGWLRAAGLLELKALTFVADAQAPLDDITREALTACFQMFWGKAKSELTPDDWTKFQRLCLPDSSDFILNLPDYYSFITYTLFYGRTPGI
jgi:ubiquinone/menaquinone biosynthesis C-methylase UbiE